MSAALLSKLLDVGTPVELVGEVAMALARAEAVQETLEKRRQKDRERKRVPRISEESTESAETVEIHDKGSLEVSPENPLPKPSKSIPLNPPKSRVKFPAPPKVSDEQWAAFCKQRKKPLNERAYTLLTNKLIELAADGHDPGEMVDLATERGWETVFPPRDFDKGKNAKAAYVSASGYEYRGDPESVMREARRRGDNDTYWKVSSDLNRGRVHA